MTILNLLLFLIVVGVVLWAVNSYIPMDGKVKQLMNIVVMVVLVVWLLQVFNVLSMLNVPVIGR